MTSPMMSPDRHSPCRAARRFIVGVERPAGTERPGRASTDGTPVPARFTLTTKEPRHRFPGGRWALFGAEGVSERGGMAMILFGSTHR